MIEPYIVDSKEYTVNGVSKFFLVELRVSDLGGFGKKCFDFFGLQETVSRNSYMTTGLYRYSLAQPAILPPAQHMRGTSKIGSFNLSISKIIFDK